MTSPPDHYDVIQRASRVLREHLPLLRKERRICREAYQEIKAANAATEREVEDSEDFEEEDRPRSSRPRPAEDPASRTGSHPRGTVRQKILRRLVENAPRGMTSAELTEGLGFGKVERRNALSNAKRDKHIRRDGKLWYPTERGEQALMEMSALGAILLPGEQGPLLNGSHAP